MSRLGDKGPYSPDNVRIVLVGTNVSEAQLRWPQKRDPRSVEMHKRKTSATLTGRKLSEEHRKHMRKPYRGKARERSGSL